MRNAFLIHDCEFRNIFKTICDETKKNLFLCYYIFEFVDEKKPFFIPILEEVKKKGVEVEIFLNSIFKQRSTTMQIYKVQNKLIKSGIKCHIWQRIGRDHRKLLISDEKTILLGSHNATRNAIAKNKEISVIIFDEEEAKKTIKKIRAEYTC